jgi:two-component system NtrC family sensor kinase
MTELKKQNLESLTQAELFRQVGAICAAVNMVVDGRELLEVSLKQTMELFGAKRGSIFILKENSKDLILKIAQGMAMNDEKEMVKRMGEGIVGRVAQSKKPIFVDDIAKDDRFRDYKARSGYRTTSFICAPLLIKDQLIGVINITDKESGNRFNSNELQLLDFLASQIALNYRRIQLYQKFKKVIKESKDLKDELGKSSQETSHLKKQVVLQEKLATIGKLAGGIAHEFNNPLDGVMRYTNLSLEHIRDDEVVRGYLLEIKHGLNRMANIVKSLLACSRNTTPTMKSVDPNYAVEQVLQALQLDLIQKDIAVKKDLGVNLPAVIDLGLERVISNIMRNAIDAVEKGGSILVSSRAENNTLVIEVTDNGCGIPRDMIDKVFEPFYTTKDIDKGCGLGLTIVSEIVKSYNGEIDVESQVQKGTTFAIKIPLTA